MLSSIVCIGGDLELQVEAIDLLVHMEKLLLVYGGYRLL